MRKELKACEVQNALHCDTQKDLTNNANYST